MRTLLWSVVIALWMGVCGCDSSQAEKVEARAEGTQPGVSPGTSSGHPGLLDPAMARKTAPEVYQVRLETTQGEVVIEVQRGWAPRGADRFYNLVDIGFFDDVAFFRVLDGFMVQFGISGDPAVSAVWGDYEMVDDPAANQSNVEGAATYAMAGPDTRSTQIFINTADNARLDGMGFVPFGKVVEGMDVVKSLYSGYGEGAPRGEGPDQQKIAEEGNTYLKASFPRLDYIQRATLVPSGG